MMALVLVQFGYFTSDSMAFLAETKDTLLQFAEDEKQDPEVRLWCVKVLGFALFITNEQSADIVPILEKLELIFANSYAKGDGTLRTFAPKRTSCTVRR